MAPNPYDFCPCGSGKKFKWCCTGYFDKIERALELQQHNQHAAAVTQMEALAAENPTQAPVWGYFAHLLYMEGKVDDAESKLERAFELNPNFPMGYLLRGIFRQNEGEIIGALLLFRKASEAYDPEARDQLAQVYELIARNEIMLNRPIASRAAMERALHLNPGDTELRQQIALLFGPSSRLPECARKKYLLRSTVKAVSTEAAATGRLSEARAAYDKLTREVPDDPAAWFNLGLVRAWLGEQPSAVEALLRSIELEWDDAKAEETGALLEVLRCGQGMENDTDYVEYRVFLPIRDPQTLFSAIQRMANERKIVAPQMDEEGGSFSCIVVEELPQIIDTGAAMAKILANLTISQGVARLWSHSEESVNKVATMIRDRVQLAVAEPVSGRGPANFGDILQEAIVYPLQSIDPERAETKLREYATNFYENVWSHRPLRSLNGVPPIDAAGSKLLRKRLIGVIRFHDDILTSTAPRRQAGEEVVTIEVYDFQRLRHKLNVELQAPGEAPTINVSADTGEPIPASPEVSSKKLDFSTMNAADLAGLDADPLTVNQLEEAIRAAIKLDARDLAVKFARAGVSKPVDPAKPDRYPFYATIITGAISEGDTATALQFAEDGANYDAAHNDGKRSNEFTARKAQLYAKSGNVAASSAAFEELIARNPSEPKFYIAATEAMLSARDGAKALMFAEKGLEAAQSTNNRDLEGACRELSEAAKKMMG